MPIHATEEANSESVICQNCENIARYRQALSLVNPKEDHILKGKVDFILKRQKNDGSWVAAEPNDANGYITYQDGERIAAEITNRHNTPIYITVLDFGLTNAITLLHPVAGSSEKLESGRSIKIGVREGDEVVLYIPDNFPFAPDPKDAKAVGGIETFKLLVTTHETDFSILLKGGLRQANYYNRKDSIRPLTQLLNMALNGQGTRDSMRTRLSPQEEWTTLERGIFLERVQ